MLLQDTRSKAGHVLDDAGEIIGSCALIAPGIIATCAHVVADALRIDRATPTRPGQPVDLYFPLMEKTPGSAHVEHWAPFDPALSRGSDLALLRLDTMLQGADLTPPIARADTVTAGREVETVCGDTPLSEGEIRQGKIVDIGASFLTIHGEGYGAKGMSGAGVWSADGDGALLGLFSGVPTGHTQTSAYAIPPAVIVDALAQLGVHAGQGGGLFEPYPRPLHAAFGPAALLDARHGIAPFVADPAVEAGLDAWVAQDDPLLVRLEYGPGGVGKTRRWLEYCHARQGEGLYGLLSRRDDPTLTAKHYAQVASMSEMRVLVVDYAESQSGLVTRLLTQALKQKSGQTRIILLARNAAEWWARLRRSKGAIQDLLTSHALGEMRAEPMGIPAERRQEAMTGAVGAYAARLGLDDGIPVPDPDLYGSALEMQMAALTAVMQNEGDDLVAAVLDRERRFWEQHETPALPAALLEAMAVAVYQVDGVSTRAEAEEMFYGRGAFRDLRAHELAELYALIRTLYPGERFLNPMQPDLIGERLVEEHDAWD